MDRRGEVRDVMRKDRFLERFTPDQVLAEVDKHRRTDH
jgi:hypothetical protein